MSSVKRRTYRSPLRTEAAQRTRRAILDAGARLLAERGYSALSMKDVAAAADVALDTIYATIGRKPDLVRELIETAISGADQAIPAEQRGYVRRLRAAPSAREKLRVYARAVREIHGRLAPLVRRLHEAAPADPDL